MAASFEFMRNAADFLLPKFPRAWWPSGKAASGAVHWKAMYMECRKYKVFLTDEGMGNFAMSFQEHTAAATSPMWDDIFGYPWFALS